MSIKKSDVKIAKNVYLSAQLRGNGSANILAQYVIDALPIFRQFLNFSEDVTIRIANFKAQGTFGQYWSGQKLVVVRPSKDVLRFFSSLAHELVHAEQYHEGRLQVLRTINGYVRHYKEKNDDNEQVVKSKGKTYNAYRNLPWEVEAFSRQDEIARAVMRRFPFANYS
jgi:hypothetical protein